MTEPTYTYIKGQGWVPCVGKVYMFVDGPYRMEFRRPVKGEHYVYSQRERDEKFWTDYIQHFLGHKVVNMFGRFRDSDYYNDDYSYMVLVPA